MTTDKATKRPWGVGPDGGIWCQDGEVPLFNPANASLIVRAVNLHDELIESLQIAYKAMVAEYPSANYPCDELRKVKATLAKAEGWEMRT